MNEEVKNKKNSNLLLVIIIVLLVIIIGLLSYKLYFSNGKSNNSNQENKNQEVENKQENENKQDVNNNQDEKNNAEAKDDYIEVRKISIDEVKRIFKGTFDKNAKKISYKLTDKEYKTNFKNLDKSNNNYNIKLNCTYYYKEDKFCGNYTVTINSTIKYNENLHACSNTGTLYNYNKYLILIKENGCVNTTEISILDENNEVVYGNKNANSYIYDINQEIDFENGIKVAPIITDSKLYFVATTNVSGEMNLISIDLSSSSLEDKVLGVFNAKCAGL